MEQADKALQEEGFYEAYPSEADRFLNQPTNPIDDEDIEEEGPSGELRRTQSLNARHESVKEVLNPRESMDLRNTIRSSRLSTKSA